MHQPDTDLTLGGSGPVDGSPLRWRLAEWIVDRADVITTDTVAVFPLSSPNRLESSYCAKLSSVFVRLLADAVRANGSIDPRSPDVAEFIRLASERSLPPDQIFTLAYLVLSTVLDELAPDPGLGASTDLWPQIAQSIRRAVFDVLSAWGTRAIDSPSALAITDQLTTLHTRPMLDVALVKESHRAERFEHWLSMILIDVDNLSDINRMHGYGVGDRVLERMGILLRTYFRQVDWVARYGADEVAVLLPDTSPADALVLADRTRMMVHDRLTLRDYRSEQRASVTVSVSVVSARALEGEPIDSERFVAEAEAALERAKASGRDRVESVEIPPRLMSMDEAALALGSDMDGIHRLVGAGKLEAVPGRQIRLDRAAVLRLAESGRH
jgi:diguanylate cyclase (GGDEF)-like protein